MKKFWRLENAVDSSESTLYLEGYISQESWWGDEVTPQLFRDELAKMKGDKLTVIVNSGGGDVWAGVSIHDALKELDAEVTIKVSGLAASIASVIAMAGDKIIMTPGSTMMIHRASMLAMGNADDMAKAIEMLETVEDGIMSIYVDRTGQTIEAVKQMLDAETWMSAEKAVELGFADEVVKPMKDEEDESLQNAFSGNFAFSMSATKESLEDYFSKVKNAEEDKSNDDPNQSEAPVEPAPADEGKAKEKETEQLNNEESEMTEAERKAQLEAEAKAAVENALKEAKDNGSIATEGIVAKAKPSQNQAPATTGYLKTKKSVEDFAQVLRNNAGKSFKEVKDAWQGQLVENGLTDPDYFVLPEPVIQSIEDAVKASGIYNLLNHTGLDVFKVTWDDTDENADTSRAGGHRKGDTKDEQILDFEKRVIRAQYIYKYLVLDKETVRENKSTGALVRFVLNELPVRIIRELERAVVIGDGRAEGNKRHITSFLSIKADVVASNIFADSYTPGVGESAAESVARARDLILAEGTVVMIAKKGYATTARFEKDADGKLLFPLGSKASDVFSIDTILEPTWFTDATDPDYDAYLVVFTAYKTVGDNSIESFTNFKLETNEEEFLQEIYKGGALSERKAAVGIEAVNS